MRYNQLRRLRRLSSSSSSASSRCSCQSHDNDGRGRQDSTASAPRRSCEGMTAAETRGLWQCMLELQRRYGCYNSTRIDLAVHAGDEGARLMPNPFIMDTLNNSVVDLPAEGWQKLHGCLLRSAPPSPTEPKPKRGFWRSRH
ncbi:hypothetical protein G6O67_004533 [Ophiocordyceps sinensis]|uniref:Uncharacterized protein n=1 Tax=Ophiocordyceps sinensis TaxID=72228 RepID=A0A8H4PPL4_9HYPO|nr:hypothetical protein G6O67_004533 [Ophiocordyceps sinensis]